MSQAAYKKLVKVSVDNGVNWLTLPANSAGLEIGGDVLDDTLLGSAGWRSRLLGLNDFSVPTECEFTHGDTALAAVRNAKLNRTALKVAYLYDGVNGYMGNVVVENFNQQGEVSGKEAVSFTLLANGALAAFA